MGGTCDAGRTFHSVLAAVVALPMFGCSSAPLSALSHAGKDAERIATLFWWMVGGGTLIWLGVMSLAVYSLRSKPHELRDARLFLFGAGVVFPTITLGTLLVLGLRTMPKILAPGSANGPHIVVTAEQWWWRVSYNFPDGRSFELANEIHLPVAQRSSVWLESTDVIHSFWVPALAGKVDTIPGRTNHIGLEPTRVGVFLGACAEYCGVSHARMLFHVVVSAPAEFEQWATRQSEGAPPEVSASAGGQLFETRGCAACHTIRGTTAAGKVGPDLTHVGSRRALGAGTFPNTATDIERLLTHFSALKPEVHMPQFDMLEPSELQALASYLKALQ